MTAATFQSALEPWGLDFTPEGILAFEQLEVCSPAAAKEHVLSSDLRRLHLAPHPANPSNFSALLSKSLQAPPEVASFFASDDSLPIEGSPAFSYCLKKPVLCMVLSYKDVRLPSKDLEDDFSAGTQGIKGNHKRLLSLKLTDGRGASFTGIELRFCPQLDAVPLLPGVKLLLLPGLVLYRGMALLSPERLQNLGGGAAQLREAFKLKADVQERRKLVQHILKENTGLQQQIKEDKGDTGPPRFVPFSFSAKVEPIVRSTTPAKKQQLRVQLSSENFKGDTSAQLAGKTSGGPASSRSLVLSADTGDLKHERLKQREKVSLGTVETDRIRHKNKPGKGGRGRRERREREEDLAEYIKPSGRPVTYNLFDLIRTDAEHTNSTAPTTLLCASEPDRSGENLLNTAPQLDPAPASSNLEGTLGGASTGSRRATGAPQTFPDPENLRSRGHRGSRRGRGRGRVRTSN